MKYWVCSVRLPYQFKGIDDPSYFSYLIPLLYYGVGFLNILIPSSLGYIDLLFNMSDITVDRVFYAVMGLTVGLELISCIFLADALCRIHRQVKDKSDGFIDSVSMSLHVTSFGLFITSQIASESIELHLIK